MSNTPHWFGKQLRALRTPLGMSLDDLASSSGVTRGALWKLETSDSPNPTLRTLLKLTVAFGCQPGAFFETMPVAPCPSCANPGGACHAHGVNESAPHGTTFICDRPEPGRQRRVGFATTSNQIEETS